MNSDYEPAEQETQFDKNIYIEPKIADKFNKLMSKYTQQQLEERYDSLPENLKEALLSVDIANKMFEIGKKHTLTIEETGYVAEETGLVVLGLEKPQNLIANIQKRLNSEEDEAGEIAHDINEKIFFPIREALKKAHNIEIEGAPASTVQKPAPLPRPEIKPRVSENTMDGVGVFPQPKSEPKVMPPSPQPVLEQKPVVTLAPRTEPQPVSAEKKIEELITKTVPPKIPPVDLRKMRPMPHVAPRPMMPDSSTPRPSTPAAEEHISGEPVPQKEEVKIKPPEKQVLYSAGKDPYREPVD